MISVLDGEAVVPPLFISSRLMAAYRIEGAGTLHLHNIGRDEEGRAQYHYLVEDTEGNVVDGGTDFFSGVGAPVDYRAQMESYLSFLLNDAEHYKYTHEMGTTSFCDEHAGECPRLKAGEWAYMNDSELQMAQLEIEPLDEEGDDRG
jgi:hypothetical protein